MAPIGQDIQSEVPAKVQDIHNTGVHRIVVHNAGVHRIVSWFIIFAISKAINIYLTNHAGYNNKQINIVVMLKTVSQVKTITFFF